MLTDHRATSSFVDEGFVVVGPGALADNTFQALRAEADEQIRAASWRLTGAPATGEIQQDSTRAHLGPVARWFCSSPQTLSTLHDITGMALQPGWSATCYTAYDGPSQHLGEHCDKEDSCVVALLLYLRVRWGPALEPSSGLRLHVFAGRDSSTPLVARISARENRMIVLHGSQRAHLRPRLIAGEGIVALTACFAQE